MKNWQKFQSVIKEADVRYAYKCEFESFLKGIDFTTPFGTDGFGRYEDLKILSEFKKDASLMVSRKFRMNVLAQALMYIKEFIDRSPENLPNVVFCGDNFACFVTDTDSLIPHLKDDIDWNRAPSSPDPKLIENLVNDENISLWTYDISDWKGFDFKQITDIVFKIKDKKTENKIEINEKNIVSVFEDWERNVLGDKKIEPHARVKAFIDSMIDESAHQNPKVKNKFHTNSGQFKVNGIGCLNFFNKYKQGYSPTTIEKFHSIQDRLIEDSKRRFQGEFFTPKQWVVEAHSMISGEIGNKWRDECLVIDCACGTANLTRDYHFKDLILTTINQEDIDVINQFEYNKGALIKQWDFLNDDIPKDIEEKLIDAGKTDKPVHFLLNPPFGTQNEYGSKSKAKISDTEIRKVMIGEGYAKPSQQLYCQFLFRILQIEEKYNLKNSTIGFYSKENFLTGTAFSNFRSLFLRRKEFINGFLSKASDYGASSSKWGVLFSLWKNGRTDKEIVINVMDKEHISKKELYWTNGNSASKWIKKEGILKVRNIDRPNQTNGLDFCDMKTNGKENSILYMHNNANCIQHNGQFVGFYSVPFKSAHGDYVFPENFMRSVALFTARKLIKGNWVNDKDEYLIPNENHPNYKIWNNDAVIHALFNTSNNCTAVRDVQYKGKSWNIKNNFFWHTKKEMMELANEHNFQEMYSDAKNDNTGESYMTTIIGKLNFSEKALKVLKLADELLKDSMDHREEFHYSNGDKNVQAWDAGYYQLKFLWREKHKILHAKFQKAYKDLEEQMRPMVYELGFLKK